MPRSERHRSGASLSGRRIVSALFAGACLSALVSLRGAPADATRPAASGARVSERSAPTDSLDDGPHVFWRGRDGATVFYLCDGELSLREFAVAEGALDFRGFCRDTALVYHLSAKPYGPDPNVFPSPSRTLAVSDIHGEYEALIQLLSGAGVIDDRLAWSWGSGHLVIDGDVFDRGEGVTECLWLIHRLEREAEAAGGRVHYVLGNHEVMVLRGDLRYVNPKYLEGIVRRSGIEYQDLFGPDMELGRWLRSKAAVVRIGEVVYVHGGLSPRSWQLELDAAEVDGLVRRAIDARSYDVAFNDTLRFLLGSEGPLWYRGYHHAMEDSYPQVTPEEIDALLKAYGARAIVVGHTEIPEVAGLYGGRVYGIDVPVDSLGGLQGLLWRDGRFYKVDADGRSAPLP